MQGIVLLKPDAPFGLPLNPDQWLYFFTLAITVVMFVLAWNILRGRMGRAMIAIRAFTSGSTGVANRPATLSTKV